MVIQRHNYLEKLIARKHNKLIKVITGIRRSGKSFLLFNLFKSHLVSNGVDKSHIIEIELDDRKNRALRDPDNCLEFVTKKITDNKMYYLFIDEVQYMSEFEDVLNSFLHIDNLDTYVTGSNSKFLSSDIITEFRGRSDEIYVRPLSFAEYCSVYPEMQWDDAWNQYYTYGGLPYTVLLNSEEDKSNYLKRLFEEVYLKDIIERNKITHDLQMKMLLDIISSNIGSLTNPQKLENTFKSVGKTTLSAVTIKQYLDYFIDAFMVEKAERYDIKGRKYVGANLKYYFSDVGLRNARLNFRQQEPTHIMENIVYNELLIRGYNVDVGIVEVYAKNDEGKTTRKQFEVDFVVNQGSQRYYIQVAYDMTSAEKQTQELNSFRNIPDSFKKIVIVNGAKKPWRNEEGFVIMGMKYFLLNPDSLEF